MPRFTLKLLKYHGTGARVFPRAIAPFPNMNLGRIDTRSADVYRLLEEKIDKQPNRMKSHFVELTETMRVTRQRSASLEHDDARQPRLATEVDIPAEKKSRKRMEGTAAAYQTKHNIGDSSSAQVDPGPTSSTSFGMKAEPPVLPRRDGVLVDKGAAAPKPCLSPAEMRTLTTAGDLLLAGKASIATRIIFYESYIWFCQTEDINSRTTVQYAMDYNSFWKMEVLETKSRQTVVFDHGGYTGRLCTCLFLGTWRTLLCGEFFVWARDGTQDWSVLADV